MNIKFTPAQQLLISAMLSILASAAMAAATGAVQAFSAGNIDLLSCLTVALTTFGVLFWHSLYNYVPAHITQILQAKDDTIAQIQQSHNATLVNLSKTVDALTALKAPVAAASAPAPQPTVIYVQSAPASVAPVPERVSSTPAALVQPVPTPKMSTPVRLVAVPPSDDLLGDLPAASGSTALPQQITGVIPTYGQSAQ